MLLCVTPNACVDKTYHVAGFAIDSVNRPISTLTVAGGKGINVARVYQTLGGVAVCTGLVGGSNGKIITRSLQIEGISDRMVRLRGESRVCIAIIDTVAATQTELNEAGPTVTTRHTAALIKRFESLVSDRTVSCVALCGSLPPGAPPDLYAQLIAIASRHGVKSALDASGEALRMGIRARPWLVKPNSIELNSLIGATVHPTDHAKAAAELQRKFGVEIVVITQGAQGAIAVTPRIAAWVCPPKITPISAVASGDSFLAALLWKLFDADDPGSIFEALLLAAGAGAANALVVGAGYCSRESIMSMASQSKIERLPWPGVRA